jgi:hypothetical protein
VLARKRGDGVEAEVKGETSGKGIVEGAAHLFRGMLLDLLVGELPGVRHGAVCRASDAIDLNARWEWR